MTPEPYHASVFKDNAGNVCFLAIDTLYNNISVGGVRISESVSLPEVKELARAMSYKFALFGIPVGGAKVGIRLKEGNRKDSAIINFRGNLAPFIERLQYIPGVDLGSEESDIGSLCKGIWWLKRESNSPYFTAIGISACLDFISQRYRLQKRRIALSGFGRVGSFLVKECLRRNIELVALSNKYGCIACDSGLDKNKLIALKDRYSDEWIFHSGYEILPRETVYAVSSDILIPGAEAYAINRENAGHLHTRFICPVANVAYREDALSMLSDRGIPFFPDFVTNAGGALGNYYCSLGYSLGEAAAEVRLKIFSLLEYLQGSSGGDYYGRALRLAQEKIQERNASRNARRSIALFAKKAVFFLKAYIPPRVVKEYYALTGRARQ